jgi:alpha-L-fucosidase 2
VYPGSQVNVRDTPKLIEAAKISLDRRGDLATGWGTAWRLCLWARMGDGERAHRILNSLLGPARSYPNMFDAHPPFQIDGNFGGAAGILEMIVQSWGGEVILLPALPKAWARGTVRGIRARGALALDMSWSSHRVDTFDLTGPPRASVKVRLDGAVREVRLGARGRYRYSRA